MKKKYKYAILDTAYLYQLIKSYLEETNYPPYIAKSFYKKGRPYVIIPKDDKTSYALGVYSGKDQNFFLENKNDDIAKQLFYFMDEERIGNQYIRPYVSLRSPLLVDNKFIHEIKKEYLIDLEKKVGHVQSISVTTACLNQVENNYDMIENQFNLLKDNYRLLKNSLSGLQKKAYITNKKISEDIFNNNLTTFNKINESANDFYNKSNIKIQNNNVDANNYMQSINEEVIDDNKIKMEYIKDRLKRNTPILSNFMTKKFDPLYGKTGIMMIHNSYVNRNMDSNNYVAQIRSIDDELSKEYFRENSKFIVEFKNNEINANSFNKNSEKKLVYMFNKNFKKKEFKDKNIKTKKDFVNNIVKNNIHINYINEKELNQKSYIISYLNMNKKNKINDLYYSNLTNNMCGVHCYLNKNEDVNLALNMIITTYCCNFIDQNETEKFEFPDKNKTYDINKIRMTRDLASKKKYNFGNLFYFDKDALKNELLSIEVKRLITEKYGFQFDENEYNFFSDQGKEIIENLYENSYLNLDAKKIFDIIQKDIKNNIYQQKQQNKNYEIEK
jgi:hypothetical protein